MQSGMFQVQASLARQLHIFGGLWRDQCQIRHKSGGDESQTETLRQLNCAFCRDVLAFCGSSKKPCTVAKTATDEDKDKDKLCHVPAHKCLHCLEQGKASPGSLGGG